MSPPAPVLPELVAHRGNAAEFPENTLPALRSALELGLRYVEFDVHLSGDSVPIVLHDANLARTAGVNRNALEMTWRELANVTAGEQARFGDRYQSVCIPRLAEVVALLQEFPEATAFVELKRASLRAFGHETVVRRVCEMLQPVASRCVVISFDLTAVHFVRQTAGLAIGWVLADLSPPTALKCEAVAPEYLFCDQQLLATSRDHLWRGPWRWVVYEVTTRQMALELAGRGAHFVETMQVRSLLRELREPHTA